MTILMVQTGHMNYAEIISLNFEYHIIHKMNPTYTLYIMLDISDSITD